MYEGRGTGIDIQELDVTLKVLFTHTFSLNNFIKAGIGQKNIRNKNKYKNIFPGRTKQIQNCYEHLFHGQRPSITVAEATAANTFSHETLLQTAAPKVAGLDVKMS